MKRIKIGFMVLEPPSHERREEKKDFNNDNFLILG